MNFLDGDTGGSDHSTNWTVKLDNKNKAEPLDYDVVKEKILEEIYKSETCRNQVMTASVAGLSDVFDGYIERKVHGVLSVYCNKKYDYIAYQAKTLKMRETMQEMAEKELKPEKVQKFSEFLNNIDEVIDKTILEHAAISDKTPVSQFQKS